MCRPDDESPPRLLAWVLILAGLFALGCALASAGGPTFPHG